MNRAHLAAGLLSLAAAVAVALTLAAPGGLRWQAHPGTVCDDLTALGESLDLSSLGDQAVIRARAVQLAAALKVATGPGSPDEMSPSQQLQRRVLISLQAVLAAPDATSHDLATALRPLARSCGVDLPD